MSSLTVAVALINFVEPSENGYNRLVLGSCASRIACHALSATVKGKGYSLSADIQYVDARWDIPVVLPLRDCLADELNFLCHLDGVQEQKQDGGFIMENTKSSGDLSSELDADAFRRIFPLKFFERHLAESILPDGRALGRARDTTIALGAVASAHGSALTKIGMTTMLAAIKMEVMTPSTESPDEGGIAIEFHMPPICSPLVRPGRPAEVAPVVSKQLADTILSSGMIDLKDLSLVSGKAAWMAYLEIYCLDADGALFDAALLSAVAAFSHLQIPVVSMNDEGKVMVVSEEQGEKDGVNKEKRKLKLKRIPYSLTCILHKNYILADPTVEEESIMETILTVVLDSSDQLVSLYKPGGQVLAFTSSIRDCIALTRQRVKELQMILEETLSEMDVD